MNRPSHVCMHGCVISVSSDPRLKSLQPHHDALVASHFPCCLLQSSLTQHKYTSKPVRSSLTAMHRVESKVETEVGGVGWDSKLE
jgi:hypothetical protein